VDEAVAEASPGKVETWELLHFDVLHKISVTEITKYLIAPKFLIEYTNKSCLTSEESINHNCIGK